MKANILKNFQDHGARYKKTESNFNQMGKGQIMYNWHHRKNKDNVQMDPRKLTQEEQK